jgi:hypothetical protein
MSSTVLKVSDALAVVAARCGAQSGQVSAGAAPASGAVSQPSATAVSAAHAGVASTGAAASARITSTGTGLSTVWLDYHENEDQSTTELRTVGERVV